MNLTILRRSLPSPSAWIGSSFMISAVRTSMNIHSIRITTSSRFARPSIMKTNLFLRAYLQLLLTPAGLLNWLAGARSIPVDRSYQPLPYLPGCELFATLGQGITQLIYAHQTELKTKIKQGHRFP